LVPSTDEAALRLTYLSPDGEEGYSGNLRVEVTYAVTVRNELVIRYGAESDRATLLSLTNQSYFNLAGEGSGDILGQTLQVFSDEIAATDDAMTLLGTKGAVRVRGMTSIIRSSSTRPSHASSIITGTTTSSAAPHPGNSYSPPSSPTRRAGFP
jgi:galactose mutarotase-like enzyme